MKGPGGTEGGFMLFGVGFLLTAISTWLFFDSVQTYTADWGFFSGMIQGRRGGPGHGGAGRMGDTTSMGIVFVPLLLGVVALFYDARKIWAWWLTYLGVGVIAVEILSHLRFNMQVKVSSLVLMLIMFGAGVGLMLRSYRDFGQVVEHSERDRLDG